MLNKNANKVLIKRRKKKIKLKSEKKSVILSLHIIFFVLNDCRPGLKKCPNPKKHLKPLTFFKNFTSGKQEEGAQPNPNRALFDQLSRAEAPAIRALSDKITPDIRREAKRAGLRPQDAEELVSDALFITLKSIRNGKFQFQDYHPAAYAMGVARKLISNHLRTRKPQTEGLENVAAPSDFNPENYLKNKERKAIVRQLLDQLGSTCRQLLALKYFEQLKDQEIIDQQLTGFTTTGSLKSKRSQCLKKMAEQARLAGITEVF